MTSNVSGVYNASLHWRTASSSVEPYSPVSPVLVLIPDLTLDGGVTNYYRTLQLDRLDNIDYFFVNRPNTRSRVHKSIRAVGIFLRFLTRVKRYSLIHVNPSLNFNSFYRDWFFITVSKLAGKKVLVFFRGWEADFEARVRANPLLIRLFRWTYGRADRVITLGDIFRRKLVNLGLDESTPVHIETTVANPDGLEKLDITAKLAIGKGVWTCLFLSRVLREKGVFTAIEAIARCNETMGRTAVRLIVAGQGPDLDAAKSYAMDRAPENVDFVGEVRGGDKTELLKRSQVLLFPTTYGEGLPNSVLEAMLAGMVIVTRRIGAIPELIETGRNGFVTDSMDPSTFADYLVNLFDEPALVARIAVHNRSVAAAFTTENVRKRLLNVYRLMLDGSSKPNA